MSSSSFKPPSLSDRKSLEYTKHTPKFLQALYSEHGDPRAAKYAITDKFSAPVNDHAEQQFDDDNTSSVQRERDDDFQPVVVNMDEYGDELKKEQPALFAKLTGQTLAMASSSAKGDSDDKFQQPRVAYNNVANIEDNASHDDKHVYRKRVGRDPDDAVDVQEKASEDKWRAVSSSKKTKRSGKKSKGTNQNLLSFEQD